MSRDRIRRHLIAYDIPKDRRRARIAKILGQYGDRIQYSVFVVDVADAALVRLRAEVRDAMELGEDSILFCDLGMVSSLTDQQFSFMGQSRPITEDGPIIL